jgi:hypothetical protein
MSGKTRRGRHYYIDSKGVQQRSRDVVKFHTYEGECCTLRFLFSSKLEAMAYSQLSSESRNE